MRPSLESQIAAIQKWLHRFAIEVTPVPEEDLEDTGSIAVWTLNPLPLMMGIYLKPLFSPFLDGTSERLQEKWWVGVIHVTPQTGEEPEDRSVEIVAEDLRELDMWKKIVEVATAQIIQQEVEEEHESNS